MLNTVLASYPAECRPMQLDALGNAGGFSGAQLWRGECARGWACLRRWPTGHPSNTQLDWMHRVLIHAGHQCEFLPVPWQSMHGSTWLSSAGYAWELTPWMPGRADYEQQPSSAKLQAAFSTLARFHVAAADFESAPGRSSSLRDRVQLASSLTTDRLDSWRRGLLDAHFNGVEVCQQILARAACRLDEVIRELKPWESEVWSLQPCLRDIWHDHVLFTGDEVSGIVDFGAMRMETVAADLARLIDSLAGRDRQQRKSAMAAYEAVRPLRESERRVVDVFQRSGEVLSGLNWICWLVEERREFDDPHAVRSRLERILRQLEQPAS